MLLGLQASHDLPWSFRQHENYKTIAQQRDMNATDLELRMIPDNPTMVHPAVINHPVTKASKLIR